MHEDKSQACSAKESKKTYVNIELAISRSVSFATLSEKKLVIVKKSSERISEGVTNADTSQSLNLSTIFRYVDGDDHIFSSIMSRAACAMNWFKYLKSV